MESRINTSAEPWLDHERMALQADQQAQSAFFEHLPPEIRRMIYVEFWKLSGSLKRHIVVQPQITKRYMENHISSSPCILEDQNGPDHRYEEYKASALLEAAGTGDWRRDWIRRIDSNWSLHWKCEERRARQLRRPQPAWSPFMNVFLTCRLMSLEAQHSLFTTLTFVFTDIPTATSFLTSYPPSTFRHLEISIRSHPGLTELYYPAHLRPGPLPSIPGYSDRGVSPSNNPWSHFCAALAACTNLQTLNLAFDIRDLRAWGDRVYERSFFSDLWRVRTSGLFVLRLPEVRREDGGGKAGRPAGEGIELEYLEGRNLVDAPFVLLRAPRPDYMSVHLDNLRLSQRRMLALPAPP